MNTHESLESIWRPKYPAKYYMENSIKVMIVEDNPHARQALMAFLSLQKGFQSTIEASNGLEAVNIVKEQIPDLVLMDMRMPVMSGLEATRIIKKSWPQVKVVMLTIYSEGQKDAFSAGADAFLVKGCTTEKMMSSIQNLLHSEQ